MRSHLFHMLIYSGLVSTFFATMMHRDRRAQLRFGGLLFAGMVGGAVVLAYLMAPFPR